MNELTNDKKELKEKLQQQIQSLSFFDLQMWNGHTLSSNDVYTDEEKIQMKIKIEELKKQLKYLDMGIILN